MSNPQKIPFARAITNKVQNEIANSGQLSPQSLPCSVTAVHANGTVTVKFEVAGPISFPSVTIPQEIARYYRPPTQIGDKGVARAADCYLGGVSGLGGGVAQYTRKGSNLSNLVFTPISNASFPAVNANANFFTAPNGFVAQDDSGVSMITLTPALIQLVVGTTTLLVNSSGVTITEGGNTITMTGGNMTINGNLTINGVLTVDGRSFLLHEHSGVQTGGGNTAGVV